MFLKSCTLTYNCVLAFGYVCNSMVVINNLNNAGFDCAELKNYCFCTYFTFLQHWEGELGC